MRRLLRGIVAFYRSPRFDLPFGLEGRIFWGKRGPSVNIRRRK